MIKFFLALFSAFLFFSCASAPKENTQPLLPPEKENISEKNPEQETESVQETNPEIPKEEIPAAENFPDEKKQDETVLEPIEDIQGYYESEPEPVLLEPLEIIKPIEETEEIPLIPPEEKIQDENPEPEKEEAVPEEESSISGNTPEEIKDEKLETPADEKTEIPMEAEENSDAEIPDSKIPEETISQPESLEIESNTEENPEPDSQEEKTVEPEKISAAVVPSRSVSMKNSQYLDIVYPGKGWIYLGEEDGKNLMRYFGRKIGDKNTSFSLRSKEDGKTILHFYKNDQLTGTFIDDYLEVEIKGKNFSSERVLAPDYSSIVPPPLNSESQEKNLNPEVSAQKGDEQENIFSQKDAQNSASQIIDEDSSGSGTSDSQEVFSSPAEKINPPADSSTDELLKSAQENFSSKKYKESLSCLDAFFEKADSRIDEGLFLQAQIFESNSSERNIKNALDNYETIVRRYPQSPLWKKASERATYLKKFYFNIR